MLTDTHCHLASARFEADRAAVIQRALAAGVTRIIAIGTDLEDSRRAIALAEEFPEVFATVGVHPCDVTSVDPAAAAAELERLASHRKVAAIGETGLDYFHAPPEGWEPATYRQRQAEFFRAQMDIARSCGLPVVVHHRGEGCWEDVVRAVREAGGVRAVFHCYGGPWEAVRDLITTGHRISFTGTVTYKNAAEVAATARDATGGSFMLETDAPYLAPVPYRGSRCEPMHTRVTAEFIAQLRGTSLEELARLTEATAEEFFLFNRQ